MNKLTYILCIAAGIAMLLNTGCAKSQKIKAVKPATVNTGTLNNKVICGYRGLFACPGDGTEMGWSGWGKDGRFDAKNCSVDLWPDVSGFDADEKYPTQFKNADGGTAYVFSSANKKTVLRHFKWMQDYGIDGVFVERLGTRPDPDKKIILCNHMWWLATSARTWQPLEGPELKFRNAVLENCRQGANKYGRGYAVMYDLSGLKPGQIDSIIDDWKMLVDKMKITKDNKDKAYLHHNGRPVVAVWGIGLNDNHTYSLDDCIKFIEFLKNDKTYGGCTVVVGLPTWWRTRYNDCVDDYRIHKIALMADVICPWTVGRFEMPGDVDGFAKNIWDKDLEWCKQNNKEYMPAAWPGFSWHNMLSDTRLNQFPRGKGQLFWKQCAEAKRAGSKMLFVSSFDDLTDGTAILKCTNTPPEGKFLNDKLGDYYLWLTGEAARMMRDQIVIKLPSM